MTTSDEVRDRALRLVDERVPREDAVRELLDCCGDKRVSAVRARQELAEREGSEEAVGLLDEVLAKFPDV
jgi:hypothetical protein